MVDELVCKVKIVGNVVEYECGNDKGFCVVSTIGKEGSGQILGTGGGGGETKPVVYCTDLHDLERQLSNKYRREVTIIEK